jgi:hypothetical protein
MGDAKAHIKFTEIFKYVNEAYELAKKMGDCGDAAPTYV